MLLWLAMNVALPLVPIALVASLSRVLGWQKSVLQILGDGQLYFFSASVCGVFAFDALRTGKLDPTYFAALLFALIFLMCFYTASLFVTHSGRYAAEASAKSPKTMALISIMVTVITIFWVSYARDALGLI